RIYASILRWHAVGHNLLIPYPNLNSLKVSLTTKATVRQEAFQKPYSTAFTAAVEEGSCIPAVVAEGCPSFAAVGSVADPSSVAAVAAVVAEGSVAVPSSAVAAVVAEGSVAVPSSAVAAAAAVGWAAVAKPAETAVAVEVEPDFEGSGVAA